jgi:ParB family transcriptional regulator, chromosome partitioning protein
MTNITDLPLHLLAEWEGNVRKSYSKTGIDELAASIKAHGLQQNLVVRKVGRNRFGVVAGRRRLKALQLLLKAGDIHADYAVPCRVEVADNTVEISLAENIMREDMHPADQFDAFRALADQGRSATDIGVRFGKTEAQVLRILKLARVSPRILKAYRDEKFGLEDVMAFAVTDDHDAQERVLRAMAPWQGAREIRAALTEDEVAATDKRVKFVALKAYEKAGGALRRDLFSDGDDGVFILDVPLLDRLVSEKLERAVKRIAKEGWKWVEARPQFDYRDRGAFKHLHPEPVPVTKDEQQRLAALQDEYDALADAWNDEPDGTERPQRLDELKTLISEIEDRDGVWTSDQLAIAGAILSVGYDGKADVERGLVRPEDMPKKTGKNNDGKSRPAGDEQPSGIPTTLVASLTAHKSAALAATLLDCPDQGLALVTYVLTLDALEQGIDTALKMSVRSQPLDDVHGTPAFQRLDQARETWVGSIPNDPTELWKWCLDQDQAVLVKLLTFCAASAIDAVQRKSDRPDGERLVHAEQVATAVGLDMRKWFTPTAENYFSCVSKQQVLEDLAEARGMPNAPAWEKLKKPDLAALAEREIAQTDWLPKPLRCAS